MLVRLLIKRAFLACFKERRVKMFQWFKQKKLERKQKELELNKKIWETERPLIEEQNKIKQEKKEVRRQSKHKLSYSKFLLIFLFINFTLLEIFVGFVTVYSFSFALALGVLPDFTPLITLISAVVGETLSYGIYAAKSKAENTEGGIVYDSAKWERENNIDG